MLLAGTARSDGAPGEFRTIELHVGKPAQAGPGDPPAWLECPVELSAPGRPGFAQSTARLDLQALAGLAPEDYGRALGRMVFGDDVLGPSYKTSVTAIRGSGNLLRVRLRIDADALQALAWERLFHPLDDKWYPIGVTAVSPFSRYATPGTWEASPPPTERPLTVLCVIAANARGEYGLPAVPDADRQALHEVLDGLRERRVDTTWLETGTPAPPTLAAFRRALTQGPHFVHVLCHGAATPTGTMLLLEGDTGEAVTVTADQLVESLRSAARPPVFVFLSACETAMRQTSAVYLPLGPRLPKDTGVQAVLAMTEAVTMATARAFTLEFYSRLLSHGQVDLAVNEARAIVRDAWDFGAPVLFSRLPDNQVIDFEVGAIGHYLGMSAATVRRTTDAVRLAAEGAEHPLVQDLHGLIDELSKSHRLLVDLATRFRDTESQADPFDKVFRAFASSFKTFYYSQTWNEQKTRCDRVMHMASAMHDSLQRLLGDEFPALWNELTYLGQADSEAFGNFDRLLGQMDAAVDETVALLNQNDAAGALARKRQFDTEMGPTFRQSRTLLQDMNAATGRVAKA